LELRNRPAHLIQVSPTVDFVDLRVSGPRTLLSRVDRERLSVVLDLAGVRPGPSVFRLQADALNLPRGVQVVRLTPAEVTLQFARRDQKQVPIRLALTGKPPGELRVTDTKVAPEVVEVIGPADEVEQIKVWETVPLDVSDAEAGLLERDLPLADPSEYVSLTASQVHAQVRLEEPEKTRVFGKVPVVLRNSRYRSSVSPTSVRVTVRGPKSTIESLELSSGAVYIDASERDPGSYKVTPSVDLPADVELVKQEPETVQLRVSQERRRADG
jgi:YbbR domain-containing protein